MKVQQYEELVVAAAVVAYGVVGLRHPAVLKWPRTPARKRVFWIVAIVAGVLSVVAMAVGL